MGGNGIGGFNTGTQPKYEGGLFHSLGDRASAISVLFAIGFRNRKLWPKFSLQRVCAGYFSMLD